MAVESCADIYDLPEDCIANVLSRTSPKDACRLSLIGSTFRSAAQSDGVWERFLPSDYRDLMSRSTYGSESLLGMFRSKKDLYFHLSDNSILIDAGLKSFTLERRSGKKCYMLAARDLSIAWADTSRYWKWISLPESRFAEVAELVDVCWLDIHGSINVTMLSPGTNYSAYLVFMSKSRMYGFNQLPAEGYIGISGHELNKRTVHLDPDVAQRTRYAVAPRNRIWLFYHHLLRPQTQQENVPIDDNAEYPKKRGDGWMEVELGQYFVKGGEGDDLEMRLMEVNGGNWKSGIIVQGIEIRPKMCK